MTTADKLKDASVEPGFREKLECLINHHNAEARSATPDFILAQYMHDCLQAFDRAVNRREAWYGRPVAATYPNLPKTIPPGTVAEPIGDWVRFNCGTAMPPDGYSLGELLCGEAAKPIERVDGVDIREIKAELNRVKIQDPDYCLETAAAARRVAELWHEMLHSMDVRALESTPELREALSRLSGWFLKDKATP